MRKLIALVLVLVAGSLQAAPVTIDFEEFNVGDTGGNGSGGYMPLQSNGFDIYGCLCPFDDPAEVLIGDNGTKVFGGFWSGPGQDGFGYSVRVELQRSDGGAFAIHSFDVLMETDPEGSTEIRGTLFGGGLADLSSPVGTGDWLNLEHIRFKAEGNQFGFGSGRVELDNVVISAVPIPAAVWLFGSALGLLAWTRRKSL